MYRKFVTEVRNPSCESTASAARLQSRRVSRGISSHHAYALYRPPHRPSINTRGRSTYRRRLTPLRPPTASASFDVGPMSSRMRHRPPATMTTTTTALKKSHRNAAARKHARAHTSSALRFIGGDGRDAVTVRARDLPPTTTTATAVALPSPATTRSRDRRAISVVVFSDDRRNPKTDLRRRVFGANDRNTDITFIILL